MPARSDALTDRLYRYREIEITVIGRKSRRAISIPVWFVLDDDHLYLLPVQGSDTQWYKNVLNNPSIRIEAGGAETEFTAVPITDRAQVSSIVEKFRAKYGADDVAKYYSRRHADLGASRLTADRRERNTYVTATGIWVSKCGAGHGGLRDLCSPWRPLPLPFYTAFIGGSIRCRRATSQLPRGRPHRDTIPLRGAMREFWHAIVFSSTFATLPAR